MDVPDHLIDEILRGNCVRMRARRMCTLLYAWTKVAFVGAGFSAAAKLPGWAKLLRGCVERAKDKLPDDLFKFLLGKIQEGSGEAFDFVAQLLEDELGIAEPVD